MKKLAVTYFLLMSFAAQAQKKYYMLIGTYTSTNSEGIYVEHFNSSNGDSKRISTIKTSNPSFLAISPNEKFVFAVNENADATGNGGSVMSFSFDKKKGILSAIDSQSTKGNHPCHIITSWDGGWLSIGNYSTGNLSFIPVMPDGNLDSGYVTLRHTGSGPDKRQASPHVHATAFSPDSKYLLVTDLGIDKIMVYDFNGHTSSARLEHEVIVAPGSGPRHLVFHPKKDFVYLLNELKGTVNVFRYHTKNGSLFLQQDISSVPAGFTGFAGSADIHLSADGKFLYASNRGDANNIAIYKVNQKTGLLTLIGHQPVLGKAPRNFSIDPSGKFLLCANQDTDEIVVFKRNKKSGLLTDTGKRISIPKPVCIKFINR